MAGPADRPHGIEQLRRAARLRSLFDRLRRQQEHALSVVSHKEIMA
ncbi:MAG: hypothetical protein M0Z84_09800 [Gammaproteobacteria bacterium]|nr:hypothetical protein [Gammaproteobacteria bacterium]